MYGGERSRVTREVEDGGSNVCALGRGGEFWGGLLEIGEFNYPAFGLEAT